MTSKFIPREESGEWAPFEMASFGAPRRPAAPAAGPDLEARVAAAESEGRALGYAAGLAEGKAHGARLAAIARGLEAEVAGFESRHAEALLDLALELARQMLRADPGLARQGLLPVVREAMRALPEPVRRPSLLLNPADAAMVREHLAEVLQRGHWSIVEDLRIEPGGCRIQSEGGDVDATLETRWKRLAASLGREGEWSREDGA